MCEQDMMISGSKNGIDEIIDLVSAMLKQ